MRSPDSERRAGDGKYGERSGLVDAAVMQGLASRPPAEAAWHLYRQRDLGIGYGPSNGYGTTPHFTDGHIDPMFRCG